MESMFSSIPSVDKLRITRVPAENADDVESKNITIPGVQVLSKSSKNDNLKNFARFTKGLYNDNEVACTLSHLKAINLAYQSGDETALILEDDVIVSEKFAQYWDDYSASAPKDWEVLQFYVNNKYIQAHLSNIADGWVRWFPDHWGTTAYIINRQGMEAILNKAVDNELMEKGDIRFLKSGMILADELIYYHAVTYTATYPLMKIQPSNSLVQLESRKQDVQKMSRVSEWKNKFYHCIHVVVDRQLTLEQHVKYISDLFDWVNRKTPIPPIAPFSPITEFNQSTPISSLPSEKQFLVITYALIKSEEAAKAQLETLRRNVDALSSVRIANCDGIDWSVSIVVTSELLARVVKDMSQNVYKFDPSVKFKFVVDPTGGE